MSKEFALLGVSIDVHPSALHLNDFTSDEPWQFNDLVLCLTLAGLTLEELALETLASFKV